jgi:phage gp36-like protein
MSTSYITEANLELELGNNADTLLAGLESADITNIIDTQSQVIDNYCRTVKTVPFDAEAIPAIVSELTMRLVKYKIYSRFQTKDIPEHIKSDYQDAFKILEKIQAGKIEIGTQADYSDEETDAENEGDVSGFSDELRWQANPKTLRDMP